MNVYHKSIDGLRAIAILGVVLYHCGINTFSGGFTGVDVFFVISGYLIIPGIVKGLSQGSFSLKKYLERRIRRIVPVLVAMLFVVTAVSYFILLPEDLDFLGLSLIGSSLFVPNFVFEKAFSYFTSANTPLIHLWSIGVEVQFYVGIALFFVIIHKFRLLKKSLVFVFLTSVLSFALSIILISKHLNPVFYYVPFRFWEFGVGALIALGIVPSVRHKILDNLLSLLGLMLIIGPMFIYDTTWQFPGLSALPSCIGAAILLYCIDSDAFIIKFLQNAVFRWVGKTAYSTYIWHFPIILFYEYSLSRTVNNQEIIFILIAIFAVGFVSWYFIENPFYQKKRIANSKVFLGGVFCCLCALIVAGSVFTHFKGFPDRLPHMANVVIRQSEERIRTVCPEAATDVRHRSATDTYCTIGDQNVAPTWALWGDSHARVISGQFARIMKKHHVSGLLLGLHGCPALLGVNSTHYLSGLCKIHNQNAFGRLANNPDIRHVVIISHYSMYLYGEFAGGYAGQMAAIKLLDANGRRLSQKGRIDLFRKSYVKTMEKVIDLGKDIYFIMPVPEAEVSIPQVVAQNIWKGKGENAFAISKARYEKINDVVFKAMQEVDKKYPGKIHWIDPRDDLCNGDACKVMVDGHILYKDSNHPDPFLAKILLSSIDQKMQTSN